MTRYIQLAILSIFLACTSDEQKQSQQDKWVLSSSETIKYIDNRNQRIQVIYSIMNTGLLNFVDTSLVVQTFEDTLLLEEIHYNLEGGDSIKWSHKINNYNSDGLVTEEVDSVNGTLRHHGLHFYESGKLIRSEFLSIIPDYNNQMEQVGSDTMKSVVYNNYDKEGKCDRVMTLSKNELSFELTGNCKFDTTATFNQFDLRGNKIKSLSVTNGDTTSVYITEFDKFNREVKFVNASLELGTHILKFEYDDHGNRISELIISDDFNELVKTEFDEQKRPTTRKRYQAKTLAHTKF